MADLPSSIFIEEHDVVLNPIIGSSHILSVGFDGSFVYLEYQDHEIWRYPASKEEVDKLFEIYSNNESVGKYVNVVFRNREGQRVA